MLDYSEEEKTRIEAEKERANKRDRELSDIKKILEIPEGRRFLWRLLSEARIFNTCFNNDPLIMASLEGRRDMGLFVLSEITTVNKNALSKIQSEFYSEVGKVKRG